MNKSKTDFEQPILALTMGDVAGVGPEVVASAVTSEAVRATTFPIVVGDPKFLKKALQVWNRECAVRNFASLDEARDHSKREDNISSVACWNPSTANLQEIKNCQLDGRCGQAAYDWLVAATSAAKNNLVDGIVTAPLNKAALNLAGLKYPGHTEILAEQCGVKDFAMMLYLPAGEIVKSKNGLGVAHVTLHTSIASVPGLLSTHGICEKIFLVEEFLNRIGEHNPRIGVCALNPHAGENGLFGNEEPELIEPAVAAAASQGINVTGPHPADTLLQKAVSGSYDGIVAMYHDQGHIALKLIGFQKAVNVTLGLPIVRTSPSHGTAFDIAWQGKVDPTGMQEAIRIAVELTRSKRII